MTTGNSPGELGFEDALKRLEAIVRQIESGDTPLEQAITLYEEGQRLKALCEARLADAEARIRQLEIGPDGKPAGETPFSA
ncbi:MAG: exodeoxyribonuclease VII small subunit [Thermaurantiacus sp.]